MTEEATKPRAEFHHFTEAEIRKALEGDEHAPIPQEVSRLLDAYTRHYVELMRRLGYIPSHELLQDPETAIEGVAMAMMLQALDDLPPDRRLQ